MFTCRKCGKCCTMMKYLQENLSGELQEFRETARDLDSGDGTCKYLDREKRLCTIYESRPLLCNNALFYETRLKNSMTRSDFDEILISSCNLIRSDIVS